MGATVRYARPDDAAALAAIASVPVELEGATVTIDRGDDFFASFRLAEDATIVVAEVDGRPVGIYSGVLHSAPVGGTTRQMLGLHQCRIDPDHQRDGLYPKMAGLLVGTYDGRMEAAHTFIHPDNAAARRLTVVDAWTVHPLRAVLRCERLAGPPAGKAATAADAAEIAEVLNTFHCDEEMYLPYTAESLAARLARAPEVYGWDDVVVGGGAVVGMWTRGERRCWQTRGGAGTATESVRAWVMDYGCLPGSESTLERLFRDRCRVAAEAGMTHLTVFTSETSPSRALLEPLAEDFEPYEFRTAYLDEPANAAQSGIYVDPVYF